MKRFFLIALAAISIATSTSAGIVYQAAIKPGAEGYYTTPLEKGRVSIVYTGALGMAREKVVQLALLRAAEFTTESGQEWFALLSSVTKSIKSGAPDDSDVASKGGHFMGAGAEAGGSTGVADGKGAIDNASNPAGPLVPNSLMERWRGANLYQTVLIIQMGSGDNASFEGVVKSPQILPAAATAEAIRSKLGINK